MTKYVIYKNNDNKYDIEFHKHGTKHTVCDIELHEAFEFLNETEFDEIICETNPDFRRDEVKIENTTWQTVFTPLSEKFDNAFEIVKNFANKEDYCDDCTWIIVKDKLPEKEGKYLAAFEMGHEICVSICIFTAQGEWFAIFGAKIEPKFWMEIPIVPDVEKK